MVQIPHKADRTKSGLYMDTSFPTGKEYNYREECAKVAAMVIKSEEGRYMKKWNQIGKLRATIKREVARVPRVPDEKTLGAERYNQIHATVVASSCEDVQEGDDVYFGYLVIPNLIEDGHVITYDDRLVGFPLASTCYFSIRQQNITMLNDYVLVEPIPVDIGGLAIATENNKFEQTKGIVAAAPKDSELKKGDVIVFEPGCDNPLEYDLIQTLPQIYFCMHEWEILGKLNGK